MKAWMVRLGLEPGAYLDAIIDCSNKYPTNHCQNYKVLIMSL